MIPENHIQGLTSTVPLDQVYTPDDAKTIEGLLQWNNPDEIESAIDTTASFSAGSLLDSLCNPKNKSSLDKLLKEEHILQASEILKQNWYGIQWTQYEPTNISKEALEDIKKAVDIISQGDIKKYFEILTCKSEYKQNIQKYFQEYLKPDEKDSNELFLEQTYLFANENTQKIKQILRLYNIPDTKENVSYIKSSFFDHQKDHIIIMDRKNFPSPIEINEWEKAKNTHKETYNKYFITAILNTLILTGRNQRGVNNIQTLSSNTFNNASENETIFQHMVNTNIFQSQEEMKQIFSEVKESYLKYEGSYESLPLAIINAKYPVHYMEQKIIENLLSYAKIPISKDNEENIQDLLSLSEKTMNSLGNRFSNSKNIIDAVILSKRMDKINKFIHNAIDIETKYSGQLYITTAMIADIRNISSNKHTPNGLKDLHTPIRAENRTLKEITNTINHFDKWIQTNYPSYYELLNQNWKTIYQHINIPSEVPRNIFSNQQTYEALKTIFSREENTPNLNTLWETFCKREGFEKPLNIRIDNLEIKNGSDGAENQHKTKEYRRFFNLLKVLFTASNQDNITFEKWIESDTFKYYLLLHKNLRMESHIFIGAKPSIVTSKNLTVDELPSIINIGRNTDALFMVLESLPQMKMDMISFVNNLLSSIPLQKRDKYIQRI